MNEISKKLKELRTKNNLSLDNLSALLKNEGINITKNGLSAYELKKTEPPLNTLITLSKIFNVPTDYLLGVPQRSTFINMFLDPSIDDRDTILYGSCIKIVEDLIKISSTNKTGIKSLYHVLDCFKEFTQSVVSEKKAIDNPEEVIKGEVKPTSYYHQKLFLAIKEYMYILNKDI